MIAERHTYKLSPFQAEAFVEIHKRAPKLPKHPKVRLYTYRYGAGDLATIEFEFDSVSEAETFWPTWFALPETPAFLAEFQTHVRQVVSVEIWDMH